MTGAFKQLCTVMITRWRNVPISECEIRVLMYSIICTYHKQYVGNWNNVVALYVFRRPYLINEVHYNGVIMGSMASQITRLTIVYSSVYSGADQRKHHSPASLPFVWGIHRWPVNSPLKGPITRKLFPFDDVIMKTKFWDVSAAFKKKCLLTCEKVSMSYIHVLKRTVKKHV